MLNIWKRKKTSSVDLDKHLSLPWTRTIQETWFSAEKFKTICNAFCNLTLYGFKVLDSYYFSAQLFCSWLTFAPGAWHPRAPACSGACRISLMWSEGAAVLQMPRVSFFLPFVRIALNEQVEEEKGSLYLWTFPHC